MSTSPSEITIKRGDVVWLKSGGPAMTAGEITGDHVQVAWFPTASATLNVASIQVELLVATKPEDGRRIQARPVTVEG